MEGLIRYIESVANIYGIIGIIILVISIINVILFWILCIDVGALRKQNKTLNENILALMNEQRKVSNNNKYNYQREQGQAQEMESIET